MVYLPSEKYESPMGILFPTEWKNNVPNHQPVMENSIKQCPILGNLHEQLGDVD